MLRRLGPCQMLHVHVRYNVQSCLVIPRCQGTRKNKKMKQFIVSICNDHVYNPLITFNTKLQEYMTENILVSISNYILI